MSAAPKPAAPALRANEHGQTIYRPDGDTLRRFMSSDAPVRIIRGPIRSGTSSACCQEIYRRARLQAPSPDGLRRTRWAIVRNTYPDLQQSTIKTWLDWFPESQFGRFVWSKPMVHHVKPKARPDVYCEVVFLALDKPEDVGKLRSTEWTGIWFNELEYIPKEVFDEAQSRVGYYPAIKDGGCTWAGVLGDMNAPSEDNWLVMMTGEVPLPDTMNESDKQAYKWPTDWEYFVQPPGLIEKFGPDGKTVVSYDINPKAENLEWIPKRNGVPLYLSVIEGKSKAWIDSRIMNRITVPVEGDPVHTQFQVETHVAKSQLLVAKNHPILGGLDFGRSPALVLGQFVNGRWTILYEMMGHDEGAVLFAPRVAAELAMRFPGMPFKIWGDPKGQDKTQADEQTAYDVFKRHGIDVIPAPVLQNAIKTRLEAVDSALSGLRDGMPRLLISPDCRMLKMGLAGGYHWKSGDNQKVEPVKNKYSHVCDALQYLLLGGGEASIMVGRDPHRTNLPIVTRPERRPRIRC